MLFAARFHVQAIGKGSATIRGRRFHLLATVLLGPSVFGDNE